MIPRPSVFASPLALAPRCPQQRLLLTNTLALALPQCRHHLYNSSPRCAQQPPQQQTRAASNHAKRSTKLETRLRKVELRTAPLAVRFRNRPPSGNVRNRRPGQVNLSPGTQKKQALDDVSDQLKEQRQDMGLSPMTWINPTGKNLSILVSAFFSRRIFDAIKFAWTSVWVKTSHAILFVWYRKDLFGWQIPYFRAANRRRADKATRFKKNELANIALEQHEQIYTAYADGRITDIEALCLEGLSESLRQRISRRRRDDVLAWSRDPASTRAKLVSFKQVPHLMQYKGQQIFVQQATVRIDSTQTLRRGTRVAAPAASPPAAAALPAWSEEEEAHEQQAQQAQPDTEPATPAEDEVVWRADRELTRTMREYLVLQRRLLVLEPTAWLAWGFAEETTLDNYRTTAMKEQNPTVDGVEGAAQASVAGASSSGSSSGGSSTGRSSSGGSSSDGVLASMLP